MKKSVFHVLERGYNMNRQVKLDSEERHDVRHREVLEATVMKH